MARFKPPRTAPAAAARPPRPPRPCRAPSLTAAGRALSLGSRGSSSLLLGCNMVMLQSLLGRGGALDHCHLRALPPGGLGCGALRGL
jgi:hypothetical protein